MDEPKMIKMRARVKVGANALFNSPVPPTPKQEKTEQKKPVAKKG